MTKYLGSPYPITKHPKGYLHNDDDIAQIEADMLSIVLTKPGERIMELDFGCPLEKINVRQPPQIIGDQARFIIANALKKWEKRVQVIDVIVLISSSNQWGAVLEVEILFMDPTDQKTTHSLQLQIPLEG